MGAPKRIADELRSYGAPAALIQRAERACNDEARHARMMLRLARRFGREPATPAIAPAPLRDLYAFALDNAVEGCMREAFGALVAHERASATTDADVARVMRIVARDETRHAALSLDLARCVTPFLSAQQRRELHARQSAEYDELLTSTTGALSERVRALTGEPSTERARDLLRSLRAPLFVALAEAA